MSQAGNEDSIWRTIANGKRKGVPNGGSGYYKTTKTETCVKMRDSVGLGRIQVCTQ